ncbi:MAG: acyl-CoA dehydratase activase [Prevotellaceae bacterium]|jgi:predicted CoA-substrate-specific enzyme activase|nr:acyl-CoA dehydratase activase [Prevotellaceae bacterium]
MNVGNYKIGLDAGSTTMKFVVLDENNDFVYKSYRRHQADLKRIFEEEMRLINKLFSDSFFTIAITGSAGMGIAERMNIPFVQEIVASVKPIRQKFPQIRTMLDLGGEDAKMVFFAENGRPDIRMNGSCAGGTGAFIDQMASLMNISIEQLGEEAACAEKIYPIASRCGVFAKTDVQNLMARNVAISDIALSTLYAVALQIITSLARGYTIFPPLLCIGGPLTFIPALRQQFVKIFNIPNDQLILPDNSEYFPAFGAALHAENQNLMLTAGQIIRRYSQSRHAAETSMPPLFENKNMYKTWKQTRNMRPIPQNKIKPYSRTRGFIGIDSGSTTTKIVVINEHCDLVYRYYALNEGNSLKKTVEGLQDFYQNLQEKRAMMQILSSAVTGYGEDLIRSALWIDFGIVETMAHLAGAQYIDPQVSFILDIGGQDMKSIFVDKGIISNIELNEACSSGCGSFLQNFASTMNLTLDSFTQKACLARRPCNLGSRCTVFMNSKVKQALREGAGIDDIAGGLAYSVIKNCLFKVLKINSLDSLGEHIVVQGGTFRNDAVYRALELLSGKTIFSTDNPELMGAFGAAIHARKQWQEGRATGNFAGEISLKNSLNVRQSELQCKGCANRCSVVRFKFANGNICYAGNKCEKMFAGFVHEQQKGFNAFDRKFING